MRKNEFQVSKSIFKYFSDGLIVYKFDGIPTSGSTYLKLISVSQSVSELVIVCSLLRTKIILKTDFLSPVQFSSRTVNKYGEKNTSASEVSTLFECTVGVTRHSNNNASD